MISPLRLNEFLANMQTSVNNGIRENLFVWRKNMWVLTGETDEQTPAGAKPGCGDGIDAIIISPTEAHLVKTIRDAKGVVLAVKLPDTDTDMESVDNYNEGNHMLLFVIEKVNDGQLTADLELAHFEKMRFLMGKVKEYMRDCGMNGWSLSDMNDETLTKPFHTEWEYNQFGGFNGLSVSFDLQDFSL